MAVFENKYCNFCERVTLFYKNTGQCSQCNQKNPTEAEQEQINAEHIKTLIRAANQVEYSSKSAKKKLKEALDYARSLVQT